MTTTDRLDHRFAPGSVQTAICLPDDPHKSVVREDGALLYGFELLSFEAWRFSTVVSFGLANATPTARPVQQLESARRPIVMTTIEYPGVRLELRAFATAQWVDDPADAHGRADVVAWTAVSTSEQPVSASLHVEIDDHRGRWMGRTHLPDRIVVCHPLDSLPDIPAVIDAADEHDPTGAAIDAAAVRLVSSHPLRIGHARGYGPASGLNSIRVALAPGESVSGAVVIPLDDIARSRASAFDLDWAQAEVERMRAFWDGLELFANAIQVPDRALEDQLAICLRNLLQTTERVGDRRQMQVGPSMYRGLWVVDGHFMMEAARYAGHDGLADDAFLALLDRVKPSGAIVNIEDPPHLKETGISLATILRTAELRRDRRQLEALWPVVQGAMRYIGRLRAEAEALPEDHPMHGLFPVALADGGIFGTRPEFTTTVWLLAGMRAARRIAEILGENEVADEYSRAFDEVLETFRVAASRRTRVTSYGRRYLPMDVLGDGGHHLTAEHVGDVAEWHRVRPETATWAFAHAIWPGEVLAPDDPLVLDLLDLLDDVEQEGVTATSGWLPYEAVWTYAASFTAHVKLYAGRGDDARSLLYGFGNHASATGVWREEQSLAHSHLSIDHGDMPHNWASAEFVRLIRHLGLFEAGDVLHVALGIPFEWADSDRPYVLEQSPTRFGPVSLRIGRVGGAPRIELSWTAGPALCEPSAISVHLPWGSGHRTLVTEGEDASRIVTAAVVHLEPRRDAVIEKVTQ